MGAEAGLLMSVIGIGVNAYGAYREGQDASEASKYNAEIARQQAKMAEEAGALDASRHRKQMSRLISGQKAAYAGSGVELTGSPLDAMIYTAAEGELDAQIIEYNAKVKSMGYMSQAIYDERLSDIYRKEGLYRAGSTLLTGATQIAGDYFGYGYKKPKKQSAGGY